MTARAFKLIGRGLVVLAIAFYLVLATWLTCTGIEGKR